MTIRIVLAEDHQVVRDGLKMLINAQQDLEVVGEAGNGEQALKIILDLQPDVAVVDISMPVMNGLNLISRMNELQSTTKALALTANEDRAYMQQLLKLGTSGYLLKRTAADDLIQAIRTVAGGRRYIDPEVVSALVQDISDNSSTSGVQLSEREEEVMRQIAKGYATKEIAANLDISIKTVETYKARSMIKLDLHGRSDIVKYAISRGWLRDD
jgi:DNA-binding NarL/FixJ family response regulator